MSKSEDLDGTEPRGISRRTVAIGAAWAVPVIALATASPAFAASGGVLNFTGTGCKLPGNANPTYKGYIFRMSATNTTNVDVSVNITSAVLNGTDLGAITVVNLASCSTLGNPFTLPANTSLSSLALLTADATSSQNGTLVVSYTVSGQGQDTPPISASGLGPMPGVTGGSCEAFTAAERVCLGNLGFLKA